MSNLVKYLNKITPLSKDCSTELEIISEQKTISRNEIFIHPQSKVSTEVFVSKGVVRAYLIDDQGNEKCTAFYHGEEFMSTSTLRSSKGHSLHAYQALTDVEIYTINSKMFMELVNTYPELMRAVKHVKEREVERQSQRESCLLQVAAIEKYQHFLQYFAEIDRLVPDYHIASYLGVTPVTLSRIRGGKSGKQGY